MPMSAVNMDVRMPSDSTMANPLMAPVPNTNSTTPAMKVVTLESAMAEKAFSKPALMAACGDTPLRNSSRMRS